jgi:GTP-binding protein
VNLVRVKPSASTTKPSILAKRAVAAKGRPALAGQSAAPAPLVGAVFELGAVAADQWPASGEREIAFAGRSNAGKSSAINALARRRGLARTSRTPGRTRELNFFRLRGGARIVDLPGYGYAAVSHSLKHGWHGLLWSYVSARTQLVGLVLVLDARRGLGDLDRRLLDLYLPAGGPVLILATKMDKLSGAAQRAAATAVRDAARRAYPAHAGRITVVAFSAVRSLGLDAADAVLEQWTA